MTDALDAVQAEATEAETMVIEWRSHKFTVPASAEDLPYAWLQAMEDGKATRIVEHVIGPVSMDRLVRAEQMRVRDFNDFADVIAKAYGFRDQGE